MVSFAFGDVFHQFGLCPDGAVRQPNEVAADRQRLGWRNYSCNHERSVFLTSGGAPEIGKQYGATNA